MSEKKFTPSVNINQNKEQSKENIPENFLEIARTLLEKLNECEEQLNKGLIRTYGDFLEKTTSGKDVLIKTICATSETDIQNISHLEIRENIELIAIDPTTKEILGIRRQDVTYDPSNGGLLSRGEIVTRNRGQGIATVIEKTLIKVLQKAIDRYQTENQDISVKLTWVIKNQNKLDLETMTARHYFMDHSKELEKELKEKREEQERWVALYGKDGKFGTTSISDNPFNIRYQKEFQPQAEGVELSKLSQEDFHEIVQELRALF